MYYVGVDLHKETSWFYIIDKNGGKVDSKNISNKPEILKLYFKKIPKPFTLAVEATYNPPERTFGQAGTALSI